MNYIVFEGPDGVGKTSVVRAVCDALQSQGFRVGSGREPGGSPLAEKVRALMLTDPTSIDASDDVRATLMAGGSASTAQSIAQMAPGLDYFILDRWAPVSSRVFQPESTIVDWSRFVANLRVKPNVVFYLYAPWDVLQARKSARPEGKDNIDTHDDEKDRKRHGAYKRVIGLASVEYDVDCVTVNADAPLNDVVQDVLDNIKRLVNSITL